MQRLKDVIFFISHCGSINGIHSYEVFSDLWLETKVVDKQSNFCMKDTCVRV